MRGRKKLCHLFQKKWRKKTEGGGTGPPTFIWKTGAGCTNMGALGQGPTP